MRYRLGALSLLCAFLCLVCPPPVRAADLRAFVTLHVNTLDQGETVAILRDKDVLVPIDALEQGGIHGLGGKRETIRGQIFVSLASLAPAVVYNLNEDSLSLDVTVQQQVLAIMDDLVRRRGMGLILISHNLHLVSSFCDRVLVMYAGQIVETCAASRLAEARHPYTRGLLAALPELGKRRGELPQLRRDPAWMDDMPIPIGATPP